MKSRPSRIDETITLVVLAVLVVGVFLVTAAVPVGHRVGGDPGGDDLAGIRVDCGDALRGRSALAATAVTLLILVVVVTPFVIVGATLAENSDRVSTFVRGFIERGPPDPPAWVAQLPMVGAAARRLLVVVRARQRRDCSRNSRNSSSR